MHSREEIKPLLNRKAEHVRMAVRLDLRKFRDEIHDQRARKAARARWSK